MKNCNMPALFVGHGNPMNAIQSNNFTKTWQQLAQSIPKPKTIIGISAHWETNGVKVTGMKEPETIHDFGGFPRQLFEIIYPSKGSPELALQISNIIKSQTVTLDYQDWGIDHGIWSVLIHMFPKADIPVIQVSLDKNATFEQHFQMAKELASLRQEGILFLCSGNIIHNLQLVDWHNISNKYDWAKNVSEDIKKKIAEKNYDKLIYINRQDNELSLAINSAEHYIPLLYLMGLSNENDVINFFNDEIVMGSLSMTGVIIQ